MPTVIKRASTVNELNDVFSLRFYALEKHGRKVHSLFQTSKKVVDAFDTYPTTIHLIAYKNGETIGTLRVLEYSPSEPSLNEAFNFQNNISSLKGRVAYTDMMTLVSPYARHPLIAKELIKMAISLQAHEGFKHSFFLCPADFFPHIESLGFLPLADKFHSELYGYEVIPCVVEVSMLFKSLMSTVIDREITRFQEVFYLTIFEPGEIVVVEGEKGSTAYLISEGEVEVLIQKGEDLLAISQIGKGRLIGEVAMITNEPRTASIVAKTPCACISFDRRDFLNLMYDHPQRALDIFKIFSRRLGESNQRFAKLKESEKTS